MRPRSKPPFATEADLCAAFIRAIDKRKWTPYAETGGWDILLVRKTDGFQIGVQAKLKLNIEVVNQTIEGGWSYVACAEGPDCRAVLIPETENAPFGKIGAYCGFTILRVRVPADGRWGRGFDPDLPEESEMWHTADWRELLPARRHKLPGYVPEHNLAGKPAPIQLTSWKINALKIVVLLEVRGHVTRADFKAIGIDHRRWVSHWLVPTEKGFIAGKYMPDFKGQHPDVFNKVLMDMPKWAPKEVGSLL